MYFVVSWDISAVNPRWAVIDEQMRNCFKGFQQIRPVNTFYMVKLSSGDQYNTIFKTLQTIAEQNNGKRVLCHVSDPESVRMGRMGTARQMAAD